MLGIDEPNRCNEQVHPWHTFLRVHSKVLSALAADMETEQDMPLTWYYVLFHLDNGCMNKLRLQELAEAINLSQSGLTRLLDRMAEAGFVERRPCATDRRGAYAIITPIGKGKLEVATRTYLRGIVEHFMQHLSEDDVETLLGAFNKILTAEAATKKGGARC
ncbi:MAG: MarR family transcriptional regulator [Anaerolineaceae bacterium]|nr:MarR family transcriptional regulator [Anaerolineaceae bacterium]MCB9100265.1 MarR family transcriptional regulator [Anaerolineales bacterium]